MKFNQLYPIIILAIAVQTGTAQSKFSFMPGIYLNGTGFKDDVDGAGVILGLEYMQSPDHFFSIELRSRYGIYKFDDGTKWSTNSKGELVSPTNSGKARLEYTLFCPTIGVVPKLHLHLDEKFSLFLENEIAMGYMTGRFTYGGEPSAEKNITAPIFNYIIGAGTEYKHNNWSIVGSIGFSTLNFRNNIRKHQPKNYQGWIPNQNALVVLNIIFKIPLGKKP